MFLVWRHLIETAAWLKPPGYAIGEGPGSVGIVGTWFGASVRRGRNGSGEFSEITDNIRRQHCEHVVR